MVYVNLVVEDHLQEACTRKIASEHSATLQIKRVFMHQGSGYIDRNAFRFSAAARHDLYIIVRDLDLVECAPLMVSNLLRGGSPPPGLLLCIAVREVETWLLADPVSLGRFLGIASPRIIDPESITDPKRYLVDLARSSKNRKIRERVVPTGTARQAPLYNPTLREYVERSWRVTEAMKRSASLRRFVERMKGMARTAAPFCS